MNVSFQTVDPGVLAYCTSGSSGDVHFATRRILIDGEFEGDATCDDESHCAAAIRFALKERAS